MTMPGQAQPAIQEGEYVGKVIRCRVTDQPKPQPFWYWDKGDLKIRWPHLRSRRLAVRKVRALSRMGPLGCRACLLSHWICQSPLRLTAVGARFPHETSRSASPARGVVRQEGDLD